MKLVFEKTVAGRRALGLCRSDVPTAADLKPAVMREKAAGLPELSELDVARHFTELSRRNYGIDTNFYPLGSCTMKYNPKLGELVAAEPGFTGLHPLLPQLPGGEGFVQGALQVLYETDLLLWEITGMAAFTMQPLAGAHGELTGTMIIRAYHYRQGRPRSTLLIPDSAHGTNPASGAGSGFKVLTVPSNPSGLMDMQALEAMLNDDVAGLMLTCPNTLGLFDPNIGQICSLVHGAGGLVYCDGANLNAIVGKVRPGDIGFDVIHLNLHKTFGTPHGGGGPGAGPVGVVEKLAEFLPVPLVAKTEAGKYVLQYNRPWSIGPVAPFYGNFAVILRAYAYILLLGREGLVRVAENCVLNANYIKEKLKDYYDLPFPGLCKHECVFSASRQLRNGISAVDIAKGLIDAGFHPPTVYFPITVKEALMIEPTETESKETLDAFIEAMVRIARIAQEEPATLKAAPTTTPVGRLNEAAAARNLNVASLG
jgi:glycine dehydrogenase subunit 2